MEVPVIYPSCCGIDVHKKMLVACVIIVRGQESYREVRTFGTTWSELCRLVQWQKASWLRPSGHGVNECVLAPGF